MIRAALLAAAPIAAACARTVDTNGSAGSRAYQQCYSCHSLEQGKNDLTGPTLYAVIGRKVAAEPGYAYSPALRAFAVSEPVWTRDLVDRFAADPELLVPGTSMAYHGMDDPAERAALLDHLGQTSFSADNLP
jgi:cytochrome c